MKKWKKWSTFITVTLAVLLLALSPASALAQTDDAAASGPKPHPKGVLAIVAPLAARVNQEISMRTFTRHDQEPFRNAGIWALTREQAEGLREDIAAHRQSDGFNEEDADYESLANARGIFLGRTGDDGRLYHAFEQEGHYVLVAFHGGYAPGFSPINIRSLPNALAIQAPRRAPVGEEVTMTVTQRGRKEPITEAGIWAVTRENAETLREEIKSLNKNTDVSPEEKDYESLVSNYGMFLGFTDEDGQLSHSFAEEGVYALIAVKRGYLPGFTGIHIGELPKALAVQAPNRAPLGEEVVITIIQRGTEEPVPGAGVWAIAREQAETLKEELSALRGNAEVNPEDIDFETVANAHGTFIGRTDDNGQVSHAFEAGGYLLMAVKPGYLPGFKGIFIGEKPKALAIRAPRRAQVGEEVTMTVLERGTDQTVPGAGVWAISADNAATLRQDMSSLRKDRSTAAAEKDYESLADIYGQFLGRTEENGQLTHSFESDGGYLLITIKSGYFPGVGFINIISPDKADELIQRGVPGRGLERAPGLHKPFNENKPDTH